MGTLLSKGKAERRRRGRTGPKKEDGKRTFPHLLQHEECCQLLKKGIKVGKYVHLCTKWLLAYVFNGLETKKDHTPIHRPILQNRGPCCWSLLETNNPITLPTTTSHRNILIGTIQNIMGIMWGRKYNA